MAKTDKETSFLVSTAGTGFFYTNRKNKKKVRKGDQKLGLVKYDPLARKHVKFEEKKLSELKRKFNRDKFLATNK